MANVCPGGPPVPNEPVTTTDVTVTPNVPQPIYSSNAAGPNPNVAWNPTDEFCTFQFTVTPGSELIVPSTQWNTNWINPDFTNGNDAGSNPATAAGFGVPVNANTPVTGPATSGPIVIGTNTVTFTIVSGTIRVSMGNGSLFGYLPGDPVSNAVIKVEWASPVHGLRHQYFDNGTDQTPSGITNYQTALAVPASANLHCASPSYVPASKAIQDTQADLYGSADNVPPANKIWIAVGTTPGGPYNLQFGPLPGVVGNNTVGQPVQNIFSGLTPSTQYYYRIEERVDDNGGLPGTLVSGGPECPSFTTKAGNATDYIDCGPTIPLNARHHYGVSTENGPWPLSILAPTAFTSIEFSTSATGPWSPGTSYDNGLCNDGTLGFAFPGSAWFVGGDIGGASCVNHNTAYFTRFTYNKGNGQPDEVLICGPSQLTGDLANWDCSGTSNVTTTSADVLFTISSAQGGGAPTVDTSVPCDQDSYTIHYGTTPGGPYPNNVNQAATGGNVTFSLGGLTPNTTYYYTFDANEANCENTGTYDTAGECQFTTLAVAPVESAQCDPATNIDSNSATLNGTLGGIVAGDQVRFRYGTAPGGPYGVTLGPVPAANGPTSQPTGNSLAPSTTYYYVVDVLSAGNIVLATSGECNFNTQAAQFNVTDPPGGVTTTSANLGGRAFNTEPGDTTEFVWGTTPGGPYPNTACAGTPTTQVNNPDVQSCPLGGLTPNTQYCYRMLTRNTLNVVTVTGNQVCFMTAANPPPTVQTDPPTAITSTCITFNGGGLFVPSGCTYAFEYGTTPGGPYPFTTNDGVSTGASPENFSAQQCGLAPGTQYYYRALVNCGGNKTFGPEVPALTTNILVDPCEPATNITPLSATLHATSQNAPAGYTYQFRYGTTPGGPYPFTVSGGPSSGASPDPYQANVSGLTPGTTYYYTSEVLNPAQQVVAGGGECTFATTGAVGPGGFVYWCGQLYDSANCVFVPDNQGGYFDCNQV